jgi:hypothetical protein
MCRYVLATLWSRRRTDRGRPEIRLGDGLGGVRYAIDGEREHLTSGLSVETDQERAERHELERVAEHERNEQNRKEARKQHDRERKEDRDDATKG